MLAVAFTFLVTILSYTQWFSQNSLPTGNHLRLVKFKSKTTGWAVRGSLVSLIVYDILGNEIAKLVNEEKQPGSYEVEFVGRNGVSTQPSGVYYYQLKAGQYIETKKMVFLK
jgi:hypothetical protein